jgi:hypothetical protein
MVNIGILADIRFGSAADLASIAVALARLLALLFPVGAIIVFPTTFPVGMILANNILRRPLPTTFQVAKESFAAILHIRTSPFKELPAIGTFNGYWATLPVGGFLTSKVLRLPCTRTFGATCSLILVDSLKLLIAFWTDLNSSASVLWGGLAFPVLATPLGNTRTVAEIKVLDRCWTHAERLSTPGAFDFGPLSALPGMIALLAAKGPTTARGRRFKFIPAVFTGMLGALSSSPCMIAVTATKVILAFSNRIHVLVELFSALCTNYLNHVLLQKKTPAPANRLDAEGQAVCNRRRGAIHYKLVRQPEPSAGTVYHRWGILSNA